MICYTRTFKICFSSVPSCSINCLAVATLSANVIFPVGKIHTLFEWLDNWLVLLFVVGLTVHILGIVVIDVESFEDVLVFSNQWLLFFQLTHDCLPICQCLLCFHKSLLFGLCFLLFCCFSLRFQRLFQLKIAVLAPF